MRGMVINDDRLAELSWRNFCCRPSNQATASSGRNGSRRLHECVISLMAQTGVIVTHRNWRCVHRRHCTQKRLDGSCPALSGACFRRVLRLAADDENANLKSASVEISKAWASVSYVACHTAPSVKIHQSSTQISHSEHNIGVFLHGA